ncbi:MAG: transglycosylase SLT domain-containing protein [Longimicrobiales bacterium]
MRSKRTHTMLTLGLIVFLASSMTPRAAVDLEANGSAALEVVMLAPAAMRTSTSSMPADANERVDRWIEFLTGRNADRTRLWLERSGRYAPHIREQLRLRGMPEDLVYLAFIESGFSPKAHSSAGAAGIWQFMAETGRRYGLEVSRYLDERRDPIESTRAALSYLQELHARFGSWHLAAAAYNTGENRVERILRERVGGRRGDDALFWRIAPHLPRETRDYVPLMLAAQQIAKSPESFGFDGIRYQEPLAFDTAWVPAQVTLELVARAAQVATTSIEDLNPQLHRGVTPPNRAWPVRLPVGTLDRFAAHFNTLYHSERTKLTRDRVAGLQTDATSQPSSSRYHTVRRGENVTVIARRYGLSMRRLLSLNALRMSSRIYPGQRLRLR